MTATNDDGSIVYALALCIAAQRDLFRDSIEDVAEAHGCTVSELIENITWLRTATAHYAGTEIMNAAERLATALRGRDKIKPAAETRVDPVGPGSIRPGAMHGRDPKDEECPERPCARCRTAFKPTAKRRLLCVACFTNDAHDRLGAMAMMLP